MADTIAADLRALLVSCSETPPRAILRGDHEILASIDAELRKKGILGQVAYNQIVFTGSAALDVMLAAGLTLRHYVMRDHLGADRAYKIADDTITFCSGHPCKRFLPLSGSRTVKIAELQEQRKQRIETKKIAAKISISEKTLRNAIKDLENKGFCMAKGPALGTKPHAPILDPATEWGSYLLGVLWAGTSFAPSARVTSVVVGCKYKDTLCNLAKGFALDAVMDRPHGGYYKLRIHKQKDVEHITREASRVGIDFSAPFYSRGVPKIKFRFAEFLQGYAEMHGWSGENVNRRQGTSAYYFCLSGAQELLEYISRVLHDKTGCRLRTRFVLGRDDTTPHIRWASEDTAKIISFLDSPLPHSATFRRRLHETNADNKFMNEQQ
ncbi:HTH domain-containing protein [Pyramidobacter sp. C12-8]|uniref:HTH domain-containing protein n=1 Tax=Pyramidobacter sp. C12-8 TaxID=1943580 RepID=UPI00098E8D62|nr:HTH domain-containing protein [Pyramidobacter sp. C12-8]OON89721.1 hypothetical protein B0D78_02520 [Pyramidobacter sp. C12-8]